MSAAADRAAVGATSPAVRGTSRVDMRAVTRAVLDCPAVMGLGAEIATFCRGRRIEGMRLRGAVLTVHVLGRYDVSIDALCAQVSAAVRPLAPDKRIDVVVVDMVEPYPFDLADDHDSPCWWWPSGRGQ